MDYLDVIAHYPLFAFHFAVSVWGGVLDLPWPPLREIYGSMVVFIILYPLKSLMQVLLPAESLIPRKIYKRRKLAPSDNDHHAAASAISNIFH